MRRKSLGSHLYTLFQGFVLGSIVMAYVADYNRSQLPLAVICLVISILSRPRN